VSVVLVPNVQYVVNVLSVQCVEKEVSVVSVVLVHRNQVTRLQM
jgi:hypothetical protein